VDVVPPPGELQKDMRRVAIDGSRKKRIVEQVV